MQILSEYFEHSFLMIFSLARPDRHFETLNHTFPLKGIGYLHLLSWLWNNSNIATLVWWTMVGEAPKICKNRSTSDLKRVLSNEQPRVANYKTHQPNWMWKFLYANQSWLILLFIYHVFGDSLDSWGHLQMYPVPYCWLYHKYLIYLFFQVPVGYLSCNWPFLAHPA